MKELFEGAIKFQEEDYLNHKELYDNLKKSQDPHTLFISCVDAVAVFLGNVLSGDEFFVFAEEFVYFFFEGIHV